MDNNNNYLNLDNSLDWIWNQKYMLYWYGYVGGPTMAIIITNVLTLVNVVDINSKRIDQWNGNLDFLPVMNLDWRKL